MEANQTVCVIVFAKVLGLNFQIWNKNRWWLMAGVTMVSMTTALNLSDPPILHKNVLQLLS